MVWLRRGSFSYHKKIPWTPWANTIAYYPLNSTYTNTDQSWNNRNGTTTWSLSYDSISCQFTSGNYISIPTYDSYVGIYPDIATPTIISNCLGVNNVSKVKNGAPTAGGFAGWLRISGAWKGYGVIAS